MSNLKSHVDRLLQECSSAIQPDRRRSGIDNRKAAKPSGAMMHSSMALIIRCMRLLIFQSHRPCAAQNGG